MVDTSRLRLVTTRWLSDINIFSDTHTVSEYIILPVEACLLSGIKVDGVLDEVVKCDYSRVHTREALLGARITERHEANKGPSSCGILHH